MIRYKPAPSIATFLRVAARKEKISWPSGKNPGLITASAADAILIALRTIGRRGQVIVPAYTCDRVVAAVIAAGMTCRFVDVDVSTGVMKIDEVARLIDDPCVAVIATHLFGSICDVATIRGLVTGKDIIVIEDCALSYPVEHPDVARHGHFAVFSFGRGKPLPLGGGGVLIAQDEYAGSALRASEALQTIDCLGAPRLLLGMIRDGASGLRASRALLRMGVRPMRARGASAIQGLRARKTSRRAQGILAHLIEMADTATFAREAMTAARYYASALQSSGTGLARVLGGPADQRLLVSALPVVVEQPDRCARELRRAGYDCAPFWRYSVAARVGVNRCDNSGELAQKILLLPLHGGVSQTSAAALVDALVDILERGEA